MVKYQTCALLAIQNWKLSNNMEALNLVKVMPVAL
jgi:hypothetical protein